jgi:hypothetical protein
MPLSCQILAGKLEGKATLKNLCVSWRIILKWLEEIVYTIYTGFIRLWVVSIGGLF